MRLLGKYLQGLLLVLATIFLFEACQRNEYKILSKREMSQVLRDVYLTETMLKQLDVKTKRDWSQGMRSDYFQDVSYHWILDKHHISEGDFYASVSHYSRHPKTMIELLNMTTDLLKEMQQELVLREQREKEAQEKLEFDRKWQRVAIDSNFVQLWAQTLAPVTQDSLAKDSLPAFDSIHYVAQYYQYWLDDKANTQDIQEATRYYLWKSDSVKRSLPSDTLPVVETPDATLESNSPLELKPQPELKSQPEPEALQKNGFSRKPLQTLDQQLLLESPTELRTDDRRGR